MSNYPLSCPQGRLYIVTEFASKGSVQDLIDRQKSQVPEDVCWKVFIQVHSILLATTALLTKQSVLISSGPFTAAALQSRRSA